MNLSRFYSLPSLLTIVFVSVTIGFVIKILGAFAILPWDIAYSDVVPSFKQAVAPGIPYIDKRVEYPVILGFIMYFASRFDFAWYVAFHYLLFVSCALITAYSLYQLVETFYGTKKYLLLCFALAPSLFWFSYYNWDIVPVLCTVLAIYCYKTERDAFGTILLSLGFMAKFYPILFLVPVLMQRKYMDWLIQGSIFVATFLVLNAYFMFSNFQMWYFSYGVHKARNPNSDNIWAVIHSGIPTLTTNEINILSLALFLLLYIFFIIRFRAIDFVITMLLVLLAFLVTNKVFSPQYVIWLLPFFAMLGANLRAYYTLEISNFFVLFFTLNYVITSGSVNAHNASNVFVVIRELILVYLLYVAYTAARTRISAVSDERGMIPVSAK